MSSRLSPRQQELHDKLADLLREYADVVGPRQEDTDETLTMEDMASMPASESCALSEWIVCMSWLDMTDGRYFTTKINQYNMPNHHQKGLLLDWADDL